MPHIKLTLFIASAVLVGVVTTASAATYKPGSPSYRAAAAKPSTYRPPAPSSLVYRKGSFQGLVSPYRMINGGLHYSRGSFQGYIFRRR
jgi:hypothetical protein